MQDLDDLIQAALDECVERLDVVVHSLGHILDYGQSPY